MAILSKDVNQITVSHNSLKLSVYKYLWNLVECESFLESNSADILAICG